MENVTSLSLAGGEKDGEDDNGSITPPANSTVTLVRTCPVGKKIFSGSLDGNFGFNQHLQIRHFSSSDTSWTFLMFNHGKKPVSLTVSTFIICGTASP